MLESVLVADRGLGAARVLVTCRRLGIKSVLAGLTGATDGTASDDVTTDGIATDAAHLADDLVLLSGVDELTDPTAVVRAAAAAGVQAIHPGYGPLRGDARLARAAFDAGLIAVVTAGVGPAAETARALAQSVPAVPTAGAGSSVTRWVYVLGAPTGAVVLGSVRVTDGLLIAAAPTATESAGVAADHRLAHAAAAVLGLDGLAAVGVGDLSPGAAGVADGGVASTDGFGTSADGADGSDGAAADGAAADGAGADGAGARGVVAVVAGLPETHAAWELVADIDLVELQLLAATGGSAFTAQSDFPLSGVAIGRSRPEVINDIRALDEAARAGLRVDAVALASSKHAALVRVSAWGADLATAESLLVTHTHIRGRVTKSVKG